MSEFLEAQFAYTPKIIGGAMKAPVVVIGGMGGSALPGLMLRTLGIAPYVIVHRDYGIPASVPAGALYVAISYSGNTEETLSFAEAALARNLPLSVIASGGALLSFARSHGLSHVPIPSGAQPRDAVLVMVKALLALMGEQPSLDALKPFNESAAIEQGTALAKALGKRMPVFYASQRNETLSYIAKIQCNETAKRPAFCNVFPELNHNEMQGFGGGGSNSSLVAVFCKDTTDDARTQKRMQLTEEILGTAGVSTIDLELPVTSRGETLLYTWWMMRTMAHVLAHEAGVPADEVPLIASLKARL